LKGDAFGRTIAFMAALQAPVVQSNTGARRLPRRERAMRGLSLIAAFAACLALLGSLTAAADSWVLPSPEAYFSRDRSIRLTVTPRELESQLAYFEEKVEEAERGGQGPSNRQAGARGVLERRDEGGRWVVVWDKPLVNEVAPVSALVAKDGRYVVTFDDWHFVGTGRNVVAIYGADGSPIRSLSLSDLLPPYYIHALPRSVSSIDWSGEHRIDEARGALILRIVVPREDELPLRSYIDLAVDLSSGRVLPSNNSVWRSALVRARRIAALKLAAEDAEAERFIAPLRAPNTDSEEGWSLYLGEAFFRLDPDWRDSYPAIQVLRSPSRRDYGPSRGWLCEAFVDGPPVEVVMIASPASPENLLRVLPECVRTVQPGALATARIYVAIPKAYRDRAVAVLAPTGAQVIWIDPAAGIPQRRERLERFQAERNVILRERRAAGIEDLKAPAPEASAGWRVAVIPLAVSAIVAAFVAFGFRGGRSAVAPALARREKNPVLFWSIQILWCVVAIMLAVVGVAILVGG
jgi:hypothetical protein